MAGRTSTTLPFKCLKVNRHLVHNGCQPWTLARTDNNHTLNLHLKIDQPIGE